MPESADLQRRILAAFQIEYREQLDVIRAMLSAWPVAPGPVLDEAFRMAHSMKGGARVCDLTEVEALAHQLESILSDLTKGIAPPTEQIRVHIEELANGVEDIMAATTAKTSAPDSVPNVPKETAKTSSHSGHETLRIEALHLERMLKSADQLLIEAVQQERIERELNQLFQEFEDWRKLGQDHKTSTNSDHWSKLGNLGKHLQRIRLLQQQGSRSIRVLGEQQQSDVRRIGMVPISTIFEGFPKMVRDLAAEEGKKIRFTMTGSELQADRAVLQLLKDPVMHALRNALAHGIETPATRRSKGKPETGEIELILKVSGNHLNLQICDDGKGIDLDEVRSKAIRAGLANVETAETLSSEELLDFLFQPRFSTASEVTNVSGRGVGLSVVQERAVQLQGVARLSVTSSGGCCVQINVPVSISTHRLLLVRSGERIFAIPMRAIRTLHRTTDVQILEGKTTVIFENKPVLLATLQDAAGVSTGLIRSADNRILVAILNGDRPLALHVEEFLSEKNALIKPLPYPSSLSPHFSGGIFLEDGNIALVLNIEALQQRFQGSTIQETKSTPTTKRKPVVLVVDDSFTARTLQKSILETAGYRVHVAVDGKAALDLLGSLRFDAVVSDIQMPHMDGFELLSAMKRQIALADIPIVLVTSLSSKEDQERGLALGADAYIIKERFDHRELLNTIRQLI